MGLLLIFVVLRHREKLAKMLTASLCRHEIVGDEWIGTGGYHFLSNLKMTTTDGQYFNSVYSN